MKIIFGIVSIVILSACNQAEKKQDSNLVLLDTINKGRPITGTHTFIKDENLSKIFNSYMFVKDALVKSDAIETKKQAASLKTRLDTHKGCEPTALMAEKMANTNDLATQRKVFTSLSADIISLFKNAELQDGVALYVQHCPMANKGDGGDWLSTSKNIRNPYYGDEMLECGRVVEEIVKK